MKYLIVTKDKAKALGIKGVRLEVSGGLIITDKDLTCYGTPDMTLEDKANELGCELLTEKEILQTIKNNEL
jgi:hypothetical protein